MTIKTILVHFDTSERAERALVTAVGLAERFDAHLTGVGVKAPVFMPTFAAAQVPPEVFAVFEKEQTESLDKAKTQFLETLRKAGREDRCEWKTIEGDAGSIISEQARYADLVVMGQPQPDKDSPVYEDVLDTVAVESGRPVLVIPFIGAGKHMGERILIGWNETREAARAVKDAMPFLAQAKSVEIVTVNPSADDDVPDADIASYLAEHGIKAEAARVMSDNVGPGDIILSEASDRDADMIVIGAYAHSRLREMVLGGVTRNLLRHMTVPVLFSH